MRFDISSFAYVALVGGLLFTQGCCLFTDCDSGPGPGMGINDRGVGASCGDLTDCRTPLVCDELSQTCQPAGTLPEGSLCALSADCAEGLYCGADRTCSAAGESDVGDRCATTADCVSGLACVVEGFFATCQETGSGDIDVPCGETSDCLAGLSCIQNESLAFVCRSPAALPPGTELPPAIPFWAGVDCPEDDLPARGYFEVPRFDGNDNDFYRLPYPNDVRRTGTGIDLRNHPAPGTAVDFDIISEYLRTAEEDQQGFSNNPVIYFRFSQPYDWDTVRDSIRLVNIDPDSPEFGRSPGAAWLTTAGRITQYLCPNWLGVRTSHGAPLRPDTTYVAFLTNELVPDMNNSPSTSFRQDDDFAAMLADTRPDDASLGAAWDSYQPFRDYLAAGGEGVPLPADVLTAAVFTTQPTRDFGRVRDVIRAEAAPEIVDLVECGEGVESPCADGGESRTCAGGDAAYTEYQGRIRLPIFQDGTAPYLTSADGGGFVYEGDTPTIRRQEDVCFSLTVPKTSAPTGGWPLLIALHGTGGSYRTAVLGGLASELASADVGGEPLAAATLAIDLPAHGERRGMSMESPDVLFYNFINPRAARDNVAQGAADVFSLIHFAVNGQVSGDAVPAPISFDPSRIAIYAHSQGSNHAVLAVPYESDLSAVVFSGLGADLTESLLNKSEPIDIAGALPFALLDADRSGNLSAGDFHPMLAMWQGFFDSVDSVNQARLLYREPIEGRTPAHILMTYGSMDSFSPDATLRAMARSAIFPEVAPAPRPDLDCSTPLATSQGEANAFCAGQRGSGWTCNAGSSVCELVLNLPAAPAGASANVRIGEEMYTVGVRVYPTPADVDGHFVARQSDAGRADTTRFLAQALAGQVPQIGDAAE